MAAFPQPTIRIQSGPHYPQNIPQGPYHPQSFQQQHYPPSYFPIPAGWDPSVSLAHPYVYDPTQVKHRRRTTPEQLKILEETFKTDPKPNAALRKQLSHQLGMTPRVLQVWFQNRRMKVKRLAKKCESSRRRPPAESDAPESTPNSNPPSPPAAQTPANTSTDAHSPSPPPASSPSRSDTPGSAEGSSARLAPPQLPDGLRRGSLPAALSSFNLSPTAQSSPFEGIPDPAVPYRRRSLTSLQRLDLHPFAPFVAASNAPAPHTQIVPPTPPAFTTAHSAPVRPAFHHHSPSTPSYPQPHPQTNRAASFHFVPSLSSPHPLSHSHSVPYAFPPRPLPPPRPGPLPAADYSFGTPPTQDETFAPGAGAGSVNPGRGMFIQGDDDTDTEYSSRFGSIASDTSTSASASASGASAWGDERRLSGWGDGLAGDRRPSWTGQVVDMFSGLDVGGGDVSGDGSSAAKADESIWVDVGEWQGEENLVYPKDAPQQQHQQGSKYDQVRQLPISQTSELAYALYGGSGTGAGSGAQNHDACGAQNAEPGGGSGGGGGEEMLEMHHALAGYAEHPSVDLGAGYNMY